MQWNEHHNHQERLQEEKEHVVEILKQNEYPGTFICGASKALQSKEADQNEDMEETDSTACIGRVTLCSSG